MPHSFNTRPLYLQVRDLMVQRIVRGDWLTGRSLPNEFALSQELGVSIGTLRKAVEQLVAERVLDRQQGRGTFVTDRRSPEHYGKFDRLRTAEGNIILWNFTHTKVGIRPAEPSECRSLHIAEGGNIIQVHRVRTIGQRPVMLENVRLPAVRFPSFGDRAGSASTIVELANDANIILGKWEERLRPVGAQGDAAVMLQVDPRTPLLELDRTIYDGDDVPIEWRIAFCKLDSEIYVAGPQR